MKKISALALILILATALFTGCSGDLFGCSSGTAITLATGEKSNWYNQNHYEKIEYDIARYAYGAKEVDADGVTTYPAEIIAEGKYTTTLKEMKSTADIPADFKAKTGDLGLSDKTAYNYTLLTTEFTLTYNAKSGVLSGKTDVMKSELLFYTSDLMPIYLIRSETYQSDDISISIATDYVREKKNSVTINGVETVTEVASGVYDNDLMFYVIRARSSLAGGSSDSLSIFSPKDSAVDKKGKAITKSMTFSSATSSEESSKYITVDKEDKFIKNCYSSSILPEKSYDEKTGDFLGYNIERLYTQLYINEKNRGAVIQLNYAIDDFVMLGQTMSKVCLSIMTTEYDYEAPSATPAYSVVYTISDYTIR